MSELAIKVEGLNYHFKDYKALDNVSLALEKNKIYGLLGKNGAGKTTLLNILVNQLIAKEGQLMLWGRDPRKDATVLEQVCIVREAEFYDKEMKVKNIFALYRSFYPDYDVALEEKLVAFFELPTKKPYKKFSRGMKSMVFNIIGLCSNAPLTIFDEPTLGLDAESREQFYKLLLDEYSKVPRTIIISTHIIEEIENLIEEVVILHKGRVIVHDEVETLKSSACYLTGREEDLQSLEGIQEMVPKESFGKMKVYANLKPLSKKDEKKLGAANIERSPMSLQKLFVELTKGRSLENE